MNLSGNESGFKVMLYSGVVGGFAQTTAGGDFGLLRQVPYFSEKKMSPK
jgi:hypothetical protein